MGIKMKLCVIGSYAKALVMTANRIPVVGETLIGNDYRETFGGKGSDMAVQAARLGADVSFIGVVGDDMFGNEFIELMKMEAISSRGIRQTKDKAKNIIVVDMGANKLFSKQDIDNHIDIIKDADVVLAQLEIPVETALYALKRAKEFGKTTILNPAPAVNLINCDLSFVDILTPNETEARVCIGELPDTDLTNKEVAEVLLEKGCNTVIITLGGDGADIHKKTGFSHVHAYEIEVVDSNGAGDSFNASLAVALGEGKDLDEAVSFANTVAGLCCTKWETVPSYHNRLEVEEFLKNYKKLGI
jgi:ribokinase